MNPELTTKEVVRLLYLIRDGVAEKNRQEDLDRGWKYDGREDGHGARKLKEWRPDQLVPLSISNVTNQYEGIRAKATQWSKDRRAALGPEERRLANERRAAYWRAEYASWTKEQRRAHYQKGKARRAELRAARKLADEILGADQSVGVASLGAADGVESTEAPVAEASTGKAT